MVSATFLVLKQRNKTEGPLDRDLDMHLGFSFQREPLFQFLFYGFVDLQNNVL